jgi:hypothetical protein
MSGTEALLSDVISHHRGAWGKWDRLGRAEQRRLLAYVDQARMPWSRRQRAHELAFYLTLDRAGIERWLRGQEARPAG